MSFISSEFLLFLSISALLILATRPKYRYIPLLIASYIFYGLGNIRAIPILLLCTCWTFIGGLILSRHKKPYLYWIFFAVNIFILFIYKYTNFFLQNLDLGLHLLLAEGDIPSFTSWKLIAPIGLSFYIFQSSTYLNDIYRKGSVAEKNFFCYAAFVSFFPTLLSGPIQRSRDVLPQLKSPSNPTFDQLRIGFLMFLWGVCEKILIANRLSEIYSPIYSDYQSHSSVQLLLAAICFSLYIYSDFSSYSDMACGISSMLGFNIQKNFKNPYLSESLGDFWNRWHISLNNWFIENIYIPLGGNRKGTFRKYLNILIVFFISGLWHGASWHFIIWGLLNGFLVICGKILSSIYLKNGHAIKSDSNCASFRFLRRILIFFIITCTWVFFAVPSTQNALKILLRIFSVHFIDFFDPSLFEIAGSVRSTFSLIITSIMFILIQYQRREEGKFYAAFTRQPVLIQYLAIAVSMVLCFLNIYTSSNVVNTQFLYFQF